MNHVQTLKRTDIYFQVDFFPGGYSPKAREHIEAGYYFEMSRDVEDPGSYFGMENKKTGLYFILVFSDDYSEELMKECEEDAIPLSQFFIKKYNL